MTVPNSSWLSVAADLIRHEKRVAVVTIVGPNGVPDLGQRTVTWIDGGLVRFHDEPNAGVPAAEFAAHAGAAISHHHAIRLKTAGLEVVIVPYGQPDEAWIFGAGHIAKALVPLVARLGWRVIVCDDRAEYASSARFPEADAIHVGDFAALADLCASREAPWVILITRGHQHDEQILFHLVNTRLRYAGMIGSKRRVTAVRQRLQGRGISVEFLSRIHAPIGIPIGADSPDEIAISILAEMISVRRGVGAKPASDFSADTSSTLPLWDKILKVTHDGRPAVLATIVERRGSTPRGLGAQMAVFGDGSVAGTIGGGCGEEDIRRGAMDLLLSQGKPRLISVDLTGDPASETALDVCGGRYTVLLERC